MKTAQDYFDAANVAELDGRYEEANANYDKAIQLQPDFPEAFFNRAGNWVELGEYGKAIADYEQVIAYWSDDPDSHDYLAQIYLFAEDSSFRDHDLALRHAQRACDSSQYGEHGHVCTLAAAHAATGEYAEAIRLQEKAIQLASRELEAELWIPQLQQQLAEYRRRQSERCTNRGWFA